MVFCAIVFFFYYFICYVQDFRLRGFLQFALAQSVPDLPGFFLSVDAIVFWINFINSVCIMFLSLLYLPNIILSPVHHWNRTARGFQTICPLFKILHYTMRIIREWLKRVKANPVMFLDNCASAVFCFDLFCFLFSPRLWFCPYAWNFLHPAVVECVSISYRAISVHSSGLILFLFFPAVRFPRSRNSRVWEDCPKTAIIDFRNACMHFSSALKWRRHIGKLLRVRAKVPKGFTWRLTRS